MILIMIIENKTREKRCRKYRYLDKNRDRWKVKMRLDLKIILGILIIVSLTLIFGYNAFSSDEHRTVNLSKTIDLNVTKSEDVLDIGVSAMISSKETLAVYQEIVDYIGEKLGKKTRLVQRATYAEMNDLVKTKAVVAAFVCSGPYVDGHEEFGMEIIAAPQMYNETAYYSYIIVNKNSTIKTFKDLRGKKFAFTDPKSNTGKVVPTYILSKMNETPETFFSGFIFSGSHDNSIEAVAKNIVDGAAVDHLIWEYINKRNPDFTSGTKVIEKHGPYAIPPIVTHPGTDPVLKQKIRSILLDMHNDEKGKKIINKIEIEKFVVMDDSSYNSVREMTTWQNKQGTN